MNDRRNVPLKVCALGFDSRSFTALQLFFRVKCGNKTILVGNDEAEASVIDMDSYNAGKILAEQCERHPERPLILLALESKGETYPRSVRVKKPVQIQAMLDALETVQSLIFQKAKTAPPDDMSVPVERLPKSGEPMPLADAKPTSNAMPTAPTVNQGRQQAGVLLGAARATGHAATLLDERGFGEYIGSLKDIDPDNPDEVKAAKYDPKQYLQGYLQSACKMALEKNCALRLSTGWRPITIFPQSREILVDTDEQQLRVFCLVPVHSISDLDFESSDRESGVMRVAPLSSSKTIGRETGQFHRMDALIWKIALWTSAGRVPEDIDLNRPVYLRSWPNFTRLLMFPHALRIAALLSEQPRTLLDIAENLKIRQQYAFAFFSAARALGLADQTSRRSETLIAPPPIRPSSNTGLLKKILHRLLRR